MLPPNIDQVRIAASAPDHKLPELHDAAFKVLAKHGVPKSRLTTGGFSTGVGLAPDIRARQAFSLKYNYDLTDAEEVRRAEAITEEWERVTGTKRFPYAVGGGARAIRAK